MADADAGTFNRIEVNSKTGEVRLGLSAATPFTTVARLNVEQPVLLKAEVYRPKSPLVVERGAFIVPLGKDTTWISLVPKTQ